MKSTKIQREVPEVVRRRDEEGLAVLIAVAALSVFSLLGLYVSLNATTELRISDNHEGKLQADYAARAGIAHVREVMRGLSHDALLRGPDGTYSNSPSYLAQAKTYSYRNLLAWQTGRAIDIMNTSPTVSTVPDDGIVSAGGVPLIPATGIAVTAPNPFGAGTIVTGRYFVKISDNNGTLTETTADVADNPFVDGDGLVIARSMGISGNIRETAGGVTRANSVSVYEIRFKRSTTFRLDSPIVLQGNDIVPSGPNMFNGNSFDINGGSNNYGIGTIDPDLSSGPSLPQSINGNLDKNQRTRVRGKGGAPSVSDLTSNLAGDQLDLLNAGYIYNFIYNDVPTFADSVYQGDQKWAGGSAPYLGYYDTSKPATDPVQDPKTTYINGDLEVSGNMSGAGLLVITGKFYGSGTFNWTGLILVIGEGNVDFSGLNIGVTGGMYVANLEKDSNGVPQWGTTRFTMSGNSDFIINSASLVMATQTIPDKQLSYREVNSIMDPS